MKAVLFDLDNTLYPEIDYVKSGFGAVSAFLSKRCGLDEDHLLSEMLRILKSSGRGNVFDRILSEQGLCEDWQVKVLVSIYRSHDPLISLDVEALTLLDSLRERGVLVGLVTDGASCVQRKKIGALGLEELTEHILCTDELGRDCWKPSVTPFKVILDLMGISPHEAAYVGDDEGKDFAGPNKLGMLSVKLTKHQSVGFPKLAVPEGGKAKVNIKSLANLLDLLKV